MGGGLGVMFRNVFATTYTRAMLRPPPDHAHPETSTSAQSFPSSFFASTISAPVMPEKSAASIMGGSLDMSTVLGSVTDGCRSL